MGTSNYRVYAERRGYFGGAADRVIFGDRCPNRLGGGADGRGRPCSSGQRNLVREPNHPLHVVQEVGETDLGAGPGDANGADE